jgi:hypothetical protein
MAPNYGQIFGCLDELERELLRVGAERCDEFQQQNQLMAVVLLLLRSSSLLQSVVRLYGSECLDAFDAVRRAFFESWQLAFQFRMGNERGEVGRWFAQAADSWSADLQRLEEYARARGHQTPDIGRQYGLLSELAHPTYVASQNSALLVARKLGLPAENDETLTEAIAAFESELVALLYRLVWLVLDLDARFINIGVNEANLPNCLDFAEGYRAIEGASPNNPG